MTQYTKNYLLTDNNNDTLKGTATIKVREDITGKFSGVVMRKGTKVVVSGTQYNTLMSVIDDGNCEWDMIVEQDVDPKYATRDQYTLSYTKDKINFSIESMNC